MGCRHSSVDSSAPSILPPQVRVPSTVSSLFSIYTVQIVYLSLGLECEKNEINRGWGWPIKKILRHSITISGQYKKHCTIVINESRVILFLAILQYRVVNYDRKTFKLWPPYLAKPQLQQHPNFECFADTLLPLCHHRDIHSTIRPEFVSVSIQHCTIRPEFVSVSIWHCTIGLNSHQYLMTHFKAYFMTVTKIFSYWIQNRIFANKCQSWIILW